LGTATAKPRRTKARGVAVTNFLKCAKSSGGKKGGVGVRRVGAQKKKKLGLKEYQKMPQTYPGCQ